MGISRDSLHKRRATGGKRKIWRKKRKYELGRQPAMTKLGAKRVRVVRTRGGNLKYRALRLESGNFGWGSEGITRKTRILDVVYNASNNELIRTKTLVKSDIVLIDCTPFRQWYDQHYGVTLGKKKVKVEKKEGEEGAPTEPVEEKKSNHLLRKIATRQSKRVIDPAVAEQFATGRLLACVSSRPGQCGRCDGYILEGPELQFYQRKMHAKKRHT